MTSTVTITHHQTKPEYQWEIVLPEGPTIMLTKDHLTEAFDLLGVKTDNDLRGQIEGLPNGESRSIDTNLQPSAMDKLTALSVKTV